MSNEVRSLGQVPRDNLGRISRRTLCWAAASLLAGALAARLGWLAAKWPVDVSSPSSAASSPPTSGDPPRPPSALQLRVTGASMAPTLVGTHADLRCDACRIVWSANWQPAFRPVDPVICWNCGATVACESVEVKPGSLVRLDPLTPQSISPGVGDLVAIDLPLDRMPPNITSSDRAAGDERSLGLPTAGMSLSVKRIVAGPGQSITHRRGRLLIDGEPILSDRIWIPVHDDSHRRDAQSWWEPQPRGTEKQTIHATAEGFKLQPDAGAAGKGSSPRSHWLVYHHRSVHNGLRPDPVRDDVPGNVTEIRSLLPVDPLRLSLQIRTLSPAILEVAFWTMAEPMAIPPGVTELHIDAPGVGVAEPVADLSKKEIVAEPNLPILSDTTPIAIRLVSAEAAELSRIRISRPLEYTIDERLAATLTWPIVLADDQFYVLGDNVPMSIDSRHFGPIASSRLVGRIRPISYDGPPR